MYTELQSMEKDDTARKDTNNCSDGKEEGTDVQIVSFIIVCMYYCMQNFKARKRMVLLVKTPTMAVMTGKKLWKRMALLAKTLIVVVMARKEVYRCF